MLMRMCGLPVMVLLAAGAVHALPRYAAQYGQSCHLCHVNPAGGGLRTDFGSQFFAGRELSARPLAEDQLRQLSTALGERVNLGFDFRGMAYTESQSETPRTSLARHEQSTFFLMQGDLNLGLRLGPQVEAVLQQSLRGTGEAYALLRVLPWQGTVKAGRFLPFHGWHWVDHQTASRQALGFRPGEVDTGVEAELHPDHWSLSAALGNDNAGMMDAGRGKALTLRACWQGGALGGALSLGADARLSDRAPAPSRTLAGLLASYARGPLTWAAQFDQVREGDLTGLALSQELAWRLRPGLDLLYAHDFSDPDLDHRTGMEQRHRLGLDWIPVPGLALQPALSLWRHQEYSRADDWLLGELQLYLFM